MSDGGSTPTSTQQLRFWAAAVALAAALVQLLRGIWG